jgi:hypothetical protein
MTVRQRTERAALKALQALLAGREEGQALPLALIALALGVVLVTPFLTSVSVNLNASRHTEEAIANRYSADAGVEWGLWRLKNNPTLTTSTTYTETPLQPTPVAVNGDSFPTTEIRFVSSAGAFVTYDLRSQRGGRTVTARVTASPSGVSVVSWQID